MLHHWQKRMLRRYQREALKRLLCICGECPFHVLNLHVASEELQEAGSSDKNDAEETVPQKEHIFVLNDRNTCRCIHILREMSRFL